MNKGLVWGLGLLVGAPVALAGTAAILVNTIDQQALLNKVSAVVKEDMNRDLKFNGPVQLKWFPSIGVELSSVSLSEYQSEQNFLNAETVDVSLALMPLLSSNIVVDEVRASDVSVRVVKNKQGQFNFDDLAGGQKPEGPEAQAPKPEEGGQGFNFSVEAIELSNVSLSFEDQQQDLKASLEQFNFQSGRIEPGVPTQLDVSGRLKANKPAADLNLALSTGLEFELGDAMSIKLDGLDVTVQGELDQQKADVAVSAKQLNLNPQSMAVELSDLLATVKGVVPDVGQIDATLKSPGLQITEQAASGETLTLDATLVQPEGRTVKSQVNLTQVSGNLAKQLTAQLAVALNLDESARQVKFDLKSPLNVQVADQQVALSRFTGQVDVTDSALPKGKANVPLSGSLKADAKAQTADLTLASKFESTSFDLKAGVKDFAKPFITAVLNADKLDVDALLPPAKEKPAQTSSEEATQPIDELPVDLSPLKLVNADATVNVGYLRASGVVVNDLALKAVARGGKLTVKPMTAQLYEGSSQGTVVADANTNLVSIKQNLTNVQIEPLLKDLLGQDMAAGKGNVNLDLTTRGKTVGAMKAALNGRVAVALNDGAVKGFNLAESIRSAKNLFSGASSNETAQADATKQTDFSSMSVSFNVKDGVATSNDLRLMAPLFRIGGAGTIDLVQNSLDYTADAAIVATSTGQGGKTLDSGLKGLQVPVRLFGGFATVQWEVLLKDLAKAALKSKVGAQVDEKKEALKAEAEAKKEEFKAEAQEKLKDSLKGFFSR